MTPEQLRDIAAQIMRHKSTVAVEGVVPQWLHDQLHAHADALEKLKVAEEALRGVIRVADRATVEFDKARAALAAIRGK